MPETEDTLTFGSVRFVNGPFTGQVELVERLGNETVVNFNLSDGTA